MIEKINNIQNIFSYSFFDWDESNPDSSKNPKVPNNVFKKNNIVFGNNGNGKTNLIKIFKALSGNENIKLEEHWEHPEEEQSLTIQVDGNQLAFDSKSNWKDVYGSLKDKFIFFDKYFIEKYVHSIGIQEHNTPERKQERGKHIIYLGNFNKYNSEINKVNDIKNKIYGENITFSNDEEGKIKNILPEGLALLSIESDESLIKSLNSENLVGYEKELSSLNEKIRELEKVDIHKNEIENLKMLGGINILPRLDSNISYLDLFSFTVSKGVEETLRKISKKLSFIATGISLIDSSSEQCPFCEQKIKDNDFIPIIKSYQKIFDKTFKEEEEKIKSQLSDYKNKLSELLKLNPIHSNQNHLQNVQKYLKIDVSIPDCTLNEDDKKSLDYEINLIDRKQKDVLSLVEGTAYNKIKEIFTKAGDLIQKYNSTVTSINERVTELKKKSDSGESENEKETIKSKITLIEKSIFYIKNKKKIVNYFEAKKIIEKNRKVADNLESIYQRLKRKIIEHFNNFTSEYFALIKEYIVKLSHHSMDIFEIYVESNYSRRSREPVNCGFQIKYKDKSCTGSLSEGEKQTIAIAFFFAQLKKESDKEKMIILDDPITSLDVDRRISTVRLINSEISDFNQIFVFTCDELFRRHYMKLVDNRGCFRVDKHEKNSIISESPSKDSNEFKKYEEEFKNIENLGGTKEDIRRIAGNLRISLDKKISEFFPQQKSINANMDFITSKEVELKIEELKKNKETIKSICSFANEGYTHYLDNDDGGTWNELKGMVNQYLVLNL